MGLTVDQRKAIKAASHAVLDDCVSFLQDLVRIDTTNPPGINYREIAVLIQQKLTSLGYDSAELLKVADSDLPVLAPHANGNERVNVMGTYKSRSTNPNIVKETRERVCHFNGHTDVVPAGSLDTWNHDPFGGDVADGWIYGRGVSDMKGGIAAQLYAVEAVRKAGLVLRGTVEQSGVVDEETTGVRNAGAGWLVEQGYCSREKTDAVIITEPLNVDNICLGHRGTIWGTIIFHGVGSHGATPQLGVNAVEMASLFVTEAKREISAKVLERREERVVPAEARAASLTFTTFHGGLNPNSVADKCTITFDRRLVPGETLDNARSEIHSVLERLKEQEGEMFKYEYKENYSTEPVWVEEEQEIVKVVKEAIGEVVGYEAGVVCSPGSDDQRFFVRAGIESCVVYGPGNSKLPLSCCHGATQHVLIKSTTNIVKNVHNKDEALLLEDLRKSIEVMALTACEFLGVD